MRESCALCRAVAQIALFARLPHVFSSLFLALLVVLTVVFFPTDCRRGARCFSSPRSESIFLFERLRGHALAPQWPRARKFVAGAAPFPAAPASFSAISLAPQTPFSRILSPPLFFLSLFFVPTIPPPALTTVVDVDLAYTVFVTRAFVAILGFAPGVYFKRSLNQVLATAVRSMTLYTVLQAHNVCARPWLSVYTTVVWRSIMLDA